MPPANTAFLSNNDREFIVKARCSVMLERLIITHHPHVQALAQDVATDDQSAAVRLGDTYVQCSIHAAITVPRKQRGNEGTIHFSVDLGPAAAYDARQMDAEIDIQRCIERALRDSGAVDQEALCVQPGRTVWALSVTIRVLDAAGNLPDACLLAALAALMAFRRPVAEMDAQGTLTLYAAADREPLPLSLHHLPVATTFATFSEDGELLAVDPTSQEEAAATGSLTIIATPQGEICGAYKTSGIPPTSAHVLRCMRIAASAAEDAVAAIQRALAAHEVARVAARVRRRIPTSAATQPSAAAAVTSKPPVAEQPVASQLGALDLGAAPVQNHRPPGPGASSVPGPPSAPDPPTQATVRRRQKLSGEAQARRNAQPLPVQPPGIMQDDHGTQHGPPAARAPVASTAEADVVDAVDWRAAAARSEGMLPEQVLAAGAGAGTLAGSVKKRGRRMSSK